MKRHLPWIGALAGVAGVLAALHFVVFAPLKNEYDTVQGELAQSVESLKNEIGSIRWKEGKTPDPRKMDFSWRGLLEDAQSTYDSNLATYDNIIEDPDYSRSNQDPSGNGICRQGKTLGPGKMGTRYLE